MIDSQHTWTQDTYNSAFSCGTAENESFVALCKTWSNICRVRLGACFSELMMMSDKCDE